MAAANEETSIAAEARLLARYLLSVEADADIRRRYAHATRSLFGDAIDDDVAFVRRHPWSLSLIDAATALIRPRSQVRQRVFVMAALLDTSPRYADLFLAPPPPPVRLVLGMAMRGLSSSAKLVAGSLLLPFIRHDAARS